jgi:hypothetical protein
MTDRLNLTRALESSGMQSAAAERIATEIYDAIHDNVATKQDLERIEATLKADLFRIEAALKGEIALVHVALGRDIDRMVVRIVAAVVVALGVLFGALHYWPPHG